MPHRPTSPRHLSALFLPRRRFLQGALFGSLGAAAAVAPASRARDAADGGGSLQRRVLVLGAGMAGLTAALALQRCGHAVQVIE
ncbi:MAG: FAD-binding protein [Cyanobacteriota bacterium]